MSELVLWLAVIGTAIGAGVMIHDSAGTRAVAEYRCNSQTGKMMRVNDKDVCVKHIELIDVSK